MSEEMSFDKQGRTPLHEAAERGEVKTVKHLLDKGVDVNVQDFDGRTPLHCAALLGYSETVQILLKAGANVNTQDNQYRTPLQLAAELSYIGTAELLLDAGADINLPYAYVYKSPLYRGETQGQDYNVIMNQLLDAGARQNKWDAWRSVKQYWKRVVQLLKEYGGKRS